MTTIHKYDLPIADEVFVDMPEGASVLCVQMQDGLPRLWAVVETTLPMKPRHFRVFGTGNPITKFLMGRYIGTVQDGLWVWHVYEVTA